MNVKQFDAFTVRAAANGVIVEPDYLPGEANVANNFFVFNSFSDFVEWADNKTQEPEE